MQYKKTQNPNFSQQESPWAIYSRTYIRRLNYNNNNKNKTINKLYQMPLGSNNIVLKADLNCRQLAGPSSNTNNLFPCTLLPMELYNQDNKY